MRELDVRTALHKTEIARLLDLDASSLVVDELGIMEGKYRIDVAVIGSVLHGYEIKSASDNLDRLAAQQESYSKIFRSYDSGGRREACRTSPENYSGLVGIDFSQHSRWRSFSQ